jgi:NTE family protein
MRTLRLDRLLLLLAMLLMLSGCPSAHYFVNPRLEEDKYDSGYAMRNLEARGNSDSLSVVMAISGGGYRAAALGYGVLDALRETRIRWEGRERRMLEEIDFLSGASGGSLVAAYYALHRDQTFDRFEGEVLAYDLEGAFLRRALSPQGLWRQNARYFGRGDILAELLDEIAFAGKTYADLPHQRPLVTVNATDMQYGGRFEFTQDQFDHICSDLDRFPLSRAVAASMAAPLVFSPITLWNHDADCQVTNQKLDLDSRASQSRYIHLLDGGLADNTGVQNTLELVSVRGGIVEAARAASLSGIRKQVFVIVNATMRHSQEEDSRPDTPGLLRQLRSLADIPIDRFSTGSIETLKREVLRWRAQLYFASDEQLGHIMERDTDFYVIEVSLAAPAEGQRPPRLSEASTSLRISPDDSRALQRYARDALAGSKEWQRLLRDLGSQPPSRRDAARPSSVDGPS